MRRSKGALVMTMTTCLVATLCWNGRATASGNHADQARHFIQALVKGDVESARSDFSDEVKTALPARALNDLLPSLQKQMGKLNDIGIARTGCIGDSPSVWQQLSFERGELDLRLSFDATAQISGIWFVPPETAGGCADTSGPSGLSGKVAPETPRRGVPSKAIEEQIVVGAKGWPLEGFMVRPDGPGPFPLVVLIHGSGPHDADETIHGNTPFRDLADGLAGHGIASVRYIKRTRAHAQRFAAELPTFTVDDEVVDDALSAVRFARTQPQIHRSNIFLIGHSLGGFLAPRIATLDGDIAGLILMAAPSRHLHDIAMEQFDYLSSDEASNVAVREDWRVRHARVEALRTGQPIDGPLLFDLPESYWRSLLGVDAVALGRTLEMPVLVLQGERDYQVTMADFEGWRTGLQRAARASFRTYPALDHLFMTGSGASKPSDYTRKGHVDRQVIVDIATWINATGRSP